MAQQSADGICLGSGAIGDTDDPGVFCNIARIIGQKRVVERGEGISAETKLKPFRLETKGHGLGHVPALAGPINDIDFFGFF